MESALACRSGAISGFAETALGPFDRNALPFDRDTVVAPLIPSSCASELIESMATNTGSNRVSVM